MAEINTDAFEQILEQCGQFGFYQKRTYFLVCALQAVCVSLLAYSGYTCNGKQPCPINAAETSEVTPPAMTSVSSVQESTYFDYDTNMSATNFTLNTFDTARISTIEEMYNANCIHSMSKDGGLTIVLLGVVAGALIGGMLGDILGRRPIMFLSMALAALFQILMVTVNTCLTFAALRTLCGVFSGGFLVISIVLPLEVVGRRWRDFCVCLWIWALGLPLISFEAAVVEGWRNIALSSGLVCLPFLGLYFLVPESSRWLTSLQHFQKAENSIKEMISCNTKAVPNVLELCDNTRIYVMSISHPRRHTYLDLFHTVTVAKSTLAVIYTWFVGCFVYCNLLHKVARLTGDRHIDIFLPFVLDVPICMSAVIINKCIGRRWCMFLYAVSSGCSMFCVLILHMMGDIHKYPYMITALAAFSKMGVATALCLLTLITVEAFPTVIRCMAVALGVSAGAAGSLLSFHLRRFISF
ncbi:organic cation transporter protein isoform X1, partial [Argonauta hians]